MTHELSIREDGTVEAAFAGTKPWHNLGVMVGQNMQPMDALRKAHLDWEVEKRQLHYRQRNSQSDMEATDSFATVRVDTEAYLGTVGPQYVPIQNREQAEFVAAVCGEGEAVVECVGALFGGKQTFWTCKLPKRLIVGANDAIERYLILTNSHAGTGSFRAFWSPIRVVCNNTLSAALRHSSSGSGVALRHTSNVKARVQEAKRILGVADEYYAQLGEEFDRMTERKVSKDSVGSALENIFGIETDEQRESTRWQNVRSDLRAAFATEAKIEGYRPTRDPSAWLLYNTVTRYVSHDMYKRDGKNATKAERRFEGIFSKRGRIVSQRAFDALNSGVLN